GLSAGPDRTGARRGGMTRLRDQVQRARGVPPTTLVEEAGWRVIRSAVAAAGSRWEHSAGGRWPAAPVQPADRTRLVVVENTGAIPSRWVDTACREADAAAGGRFRIVGFGMCDFGSEPRWHDDVLTGHQWPRVHRSRI